MDRLWTGFEFFITVFEAFVIMHFVCAFFDHSFSSKKGRIIYICASVCYAFMVLTINSITSYEGWIGVVYSIYILAFSLIFLRGKLLIKILISIFTNICLISVNTFSVNLMSVVFKSNVDAIYSEKTLSRFLMIIIDQLILFYVFTVFLRIFKKSKMNFGKKEWIFIITIFVASFLSVAAIQITLQKNDLSEQYIGILMAAELGLILINIICFFMMSILNNSHKAAEELSMLKQQDEIRKQYAENVKYRYEEIRRIRHDMKQSYTVLETLLSENRTTEAIDYIRSGRSAIAQTEVLVDVGNDFVNSILNSKLSTAKQLGIEVICSSVKDISGIEAVDLCTLLGNMLDNAIEAAKQCPSEKSLIEVKITSSDEKLIIQVTNSIKCSVLKENSELKSTKQNPSEHGFGVKSIRLIAQKYFGSAKYFEEDNTLSCRVILYR